MYVVTGRLHVDIYDRKKYIFSSFFIFQLFHFCSTTGRYLERNWDPQGISSLSLSALCFCPLWQGEMVSVVWAQDRQIITLSEMGDSVIVQSLCESIQTYPHQSIICLQMIQCVILSETAVFTLKRSLGQHFYTLLTCY